MVFTILAVVLSIVTLVGWVLTIISAFKKGGALWGILNILLFIQPLIGVISFALGKADRRPVGLMAIGLFGGLLVNMLSQ